MTQFFMLGDFAKVCSICSRRDYDTECDKFKIKFENLFTYEAQTLKLKTIELCSKDDLKQLGHIEAAIHGQLYFIKYVQNKKIFSFNIFT